MPIKVQIKPATQKGKKFQAIIEAPNLKRTIAFGAKGMSDFTKNKDPKRKERYIERHEAREDWTDPLSAGFWSKKVLWTYPSLQKAKKEAIKEAKSILKKQGY